MQHSRIKRRLTPRIIGRNVGDQRYTWPTLSTVDGRTLSLEPGEEAELFAAPDGDVVYLKIRTEPDDRAPVLAVVDSSPDPDPAKSRSGGK